MIVFLVILAVLIVVMVVLYFLGKKMQKLASLQQEIAACYQKADEQTAELCNL